MAQVLRLPPELEAELKRLAQANSRSLHGEIVQALSQHVARERRADQPEVDTLFSQGEKRLWLVEVDGHALNGGMRSLVLSDSGVHACDWITATKWISRAMLTATPITERESWVRVET